MVDLQERSQTDQWPYADHRSSYSHCRRGVRLPLIRAPRGSVVQDVQFHLSFQHHKWQALQRDSYGALQRSAPTARTFHRNRRQDQEFVHGMARLLRSAAEQYSTAYRTLHLPVPRSWQKRRGSTHRCVQTHQTQALRGSLKSSSATPSRAC